MPAKAQLTVEVAPDQERYAPGQVAHLSVRTTLGTTPGPAAVGLFGVDDSLGQLVTLPGAGDLERIRPAVAMIGPAFGGLDGQALAMGRIRGANAAAATVLRVGSVPAIEELDATVSTSRFASLDASAALTDPFYGILAELVAQTRAWEEKAPPEEKLRPAKMAELWELALGACEKRGEAVEDAFGRRLRLSRLPPDLLALTDPHQVVVTGTRLSEDVESWPAFVAKEKP